MSFSEVISTYGYPIISKENAEAIHYARKIRNVGGVRQKKEREQNLKEEEQPERSHPFRVGGGTEKQHTDGQCSCKFRIDVSRQNWMEKGNTHRKTAHRGGYNETLRRRADITAKREQFDRAGVAQIGINGEETASPR